MHIIQLNDTQIITLLRNNNSIVPVAYLDDRFMGTTQLNYHTNNQTTKSIIIYNWYMIIT